MSSVDPVLEHYARFDEDTRLNGAFGAFEFARTRELLATFVRCSEFWVAVLRS